MEVKLKAVSLMVVAQKHDITFFIRQFLVLAVDQHQFAFHQILLTHELLLLGEEVAQAAVLIMQIMVDLVVD